MEFTLRLKKQDTFSKLLELQQVQCLCVCMCVGRLLLFYSRLAALSSRKIQFRRTVEVDPGKQATENPTVAHYIRFVRGFETRIRRTVITGEVKNSRMLRRRERSVCTARERQVPGTFN